MKDRFTFWFVFLFVFFNLFFFRGEFFFLFFGKRLSINVIFVFLSLTSVMYFIYKKPHLMAELKKKLWELRFLILILLSFDIVALFYNVTVFSSLQTDYIINTFKVSWIIPFVIIASHASFKETVKGIVSAVLAAIILISYSSVMYYALHGHGIGRSLVQGVETKTVESLFLIPLIVFRGLPQYGALFLTKKALFTMDPLSCSYYALGFAGVHYFFAKSWDPKLETEKTIKICLKWGLLTLSCFAIVFANQYFSLILIFIGQLVILLTYSCLKRANYYFRAAILLALGVCVLLSKYNPGSRDHEANMFRNRLRVVSLYSSTEECKESENICDDEFIKRRLSDGNRLSLYANVLKANKDTLLEGVGLPYNYNSFNHDGLDKKTYTGHSYVIDLIISVGLIIGIYGTGNVWLPLLMSLVIIVKAPFRQRPEIAVFWLLAASNIFLTSLFGMFGYSVMDKALCWFLTCLFYLKEKELLRVKKQIIS